MTDMETLPDGIWKKLFPRALTLIDEIAKHGGISKPFFTFGGGTVLMLRYRHRYSKDIDIFVPDPQSLGYVNPRLSDVAAEICNDQYTSGDSYVKLHLDEGEIDFVAAPNLLAMPHAFELWSLCGREVKVETAGEIVAKKMYYRGEQATARDLFDLAMILEVAPEHLLYAEPFIFRHLQNLRNQLSNPSKNFLHQFDAIETLDYRPGLEHAIEITGKYLHGLQQKSNQSLHAICAVIERAGHTHLLADVQRGEYTGRLFVTTSHHIAQLESTGTVVIHERHRIANGELPPEGSGSEIKIRYIRGMGDLRRLANRRTPRSTRRKNKP